MVRPYIAQEAERSLNSNYPSIHPLGWFIAIVYFNSYSGKDFTDESSSMDPEAESEEKRQKPRQTPGKGKQKDKIPVSGFVHLLLIWKHLHKMHKWNVLCCNLSIILSSLKYLSRL